MAESTNVQTPEWMEGCNFISTQFNDKHQIIDTKRGSGKPGFGEEDPFLTVEEGIPAVVVAQTRGARQAREKTTYGKICKLYKDSNGRKPEGLTPDEEKYWEYVDARAKEQANNRQDSGMEI